MRTLKNLEKKERGKPGFPCSLYEVGSKDSCYEMPFHWHTEYEIIIVTKGKIELTYDEETVMAKAGDVFFLSDGILHGGHPQGNDCKYFCVVFSTELLNKIPNESLKEIFLHGRKVKTYIDGEKYKNVYETGKRLCLSLKNQEKDEDNIISLGIMLEFFGVLMKNGLCSEGFMETNRHTEKLKKVLSYMESHYQEKITLDNLAEAAGVNARYLCRSFCSLTGKTPIQYLNEYRIDCACEMLRITDKTILEIAISCGFGDQSYFVKWFRRLKGVTPKTYRTEASVIK